MGKTIADAIRHINVTPDRLGLATISDKIRRGEKIIAVIKHQDGTKTVIGNG